MTRPSGEGGGQQGDVARAKGGVLVRNTVIYAASNLLPQAVNYLLLPVFTRYLSTDDYGVIASMQTLTNILVIVYTMALDRAMPRLYADSLDVTRQRIYGGTLALAVLGASTIFTGLTILLRGPVSRIYPSIAFTPFYLYAILTAYLGCFAVVPRTIYRITDRAPPFLLLAVAQSGLSVGLSLWLVVARGQGATGALGAKLLADAILVPILIVITLRNTKLSFDGRMFVRSIVFSAPLMPSLLSAWVLNWSDRLFMERYAGLGDLGVYSAGYRIGQVGLLLYTAIQMAYAPTFYRLATREGEAAKERLAGYNHAIILACSVASFGVALFSREIVTLLLDKRYAAAYAVIPIVSLAYLISAFSSVVTLGIYQDKKTLQIMLIIVAGAVASLLLNWLLIPRYLAVGAAVATAGAFLLMTVLQYWYSRRCYHVPTYWRRLAPVLVVFTVTVVLFVYVLRLSVWLSVTLKTVAFGGAVAAVWLLEGSRFRNLLRASGADAHGRRA